MMSPEISRDWQRFAGMPAGVTGTRGPLSAFQRANLMAVLADLMPAELHHGDCTGADAEAHMIAMALGTPVIVHPPLIGLYRAFCDPGPGGQVRVPHPYLARNKMIIAESWFLIAVPSGSRPASPAGSGTWTTVRYAEQAGMGTVILYPDGSVRVDGTHVVR